jgi:glycosyltransferase involved in cell wall biosynthesis
MINNIKIIHVEHCSHSYFLVNGKGNPDEILKGSWATQVAKETKKIYPSLDIECWFPEKIERKMKEFEFSGIRMRVFPTTFSPRYALDFSWPMLKALKKEAAKCKKNRTKLIIHLHEYHNLHGLAISFLFRKENMIAQHHGGSFPLKHLMSNKRFRIFAPFFFIGQLAEDLALKNIKTFFALSREEIDYLKKIAQKSKVKFQTMGIENSYFKNVDKNMARKKLKIELDKKIIVYIGRISEEKGVRYLLNAMNELKDVELKILGYTQGLDYFKNYAKEKKLSNVEFLGGVFGERKRLYLSAADALILPSSKEGAPVVIMEAMSRNLPVVVSDVGGVPLMVENGKNGIMIKPKSAQKIAKAVREILKWPKKDFKEYAKNYRWKKIIEETVKEYLILACNQI